MKKVIFILLILLINIQFIAAQEYRGGLSADIKINGRLKADVDLETRRIFFPGTYINRTAQIGLGYQLKPNLSAKVLYSYAYITRNSEFDKITGDETSDRNRYMFDIQYSPKRFSNDLKLSNRLRYQYTVVRNNKPKQYLRNKFTVDYKITAKMNPYVAIEPYYQIDNNEFRLVRLYIGNEVPVWKTKLDLYYITEFNFLPEHLTTQYTLGLMFEFDW
jgi:hypothetical protein